VERSGLAEAFTSLKYDDTPTQLMLSFKKMGNDAFANGRRNVAKNVQFYRDAINHYYEAIAWAEKIEPMLPGDLRAADNDDQTYTEQELNALKASLCCNAALSHSQLKNWGHSRNDAKKAIAFDKMNVKAWFRLAKAHQMLQNWEDAGDAIDNGLAIPGQKDNVDLNKLQTQVAAKVSRARKLRQQRERARAQRVSQVKQVWKHCKDENIQLGRVPLVASVADDEDGTDEESKWHHHRPNSGNLPEASNGDWVWPCMFLYPSHKQSDFVKHFGESEMLALRMAQMFPEAEDGDGQTSMPWDYNNEFTCSKLAVYFEVHCSDGDSLVHPEYVSKLTDQGEAMRFYEAARALRGDEGADIANLVRAVERKNLHQQRKAWKKKNGSIWSTPGPCPVVRVHPAVTLGQVLTDKRMVVPNVRVPSILHV
jgi:tetratricopeptide (TPR) repeat protein